MTPEISADDGLHFETGRHYCAIFNSDDEWRQCVRALLQQALARHERFLYLHHSHTPRKVMSCLKDIDGVSAAVEAGQVILAPGATCYYPHGRFEPELLVQGPEATVAEALADGYSGVVATGEATISQESIPGMERFLEYEALLEASPQPGFTCLCQYDRRLLPPDFISDSLLVHQHIVCDGRILRNHYYVPPERYLTPDRAENTLVARLEALRGLEEAQTALRKSEERYRTVADYAYDWEYWYAPDKRLLYMSPSCERITGYTAAEFAADDDLFHRIIHPEDAQSLRDHLQECRGEDAMGEFECRIIRRDGGIRWISHCCQSVYGHSGESLGRRATNRDITERKRGRLERERLTAELEAVFASLCSPVIVYGSDFSVLHANERAYYHCGEDMAELDFQALVERLQVRLPVDSAASVEDLSLETLLNGEQPLTGVPIQLRDVHGEDLRGLCSVVPLKIGGEIAGAVVSWHDVTALEDSLQATHGRAEELETVISNIADGITITDPDGRIVRCNHAAQRHHGLSESCLGLSYSERFRALEGDRTYHRADGSDYSIEDLPLQRALGGETVVGETVEVVFSDGAAAWLNTSAAPLHDAGGAVTGAVSVSADVTAFRKAAAEREQLLSQVQAERIAARQLADELETVFASLSECVLVLDNDGTCVRANPAAVELYGCELAGMSQKERTKRIKVFSLDGSPLMADEFYSMHALHGDENDDGRCRFINAQGVEFEVVAQASPLWSEGQIVGTVLSWRDVTTTERLLQTLAGSQEELQRHRDYLEDLVEQRTAELVEHRERLRLMASQVALAEEQERRRIATAIHDDVSQTLAFAKMRLAALQNERDLPAMEAGHADLLALMDDAIAATRTLTLELSPPVLYQMGFEPALRWLGAHMAQVHGYRVSVHIDKKPKPLSSDLEVTLFQCARELLTNAAKYAACTVAEVSLRRNNGFVELTISDDGRGFDPAKVKTTVGSGFGLFSIRERVTYLGGELQIESARGKGSRLVLRVPVSEAAEASQQKRKGL
ncbi:MAG: PAS domain S-box protein [Bacteroidota bacterium]